VLVFIFGAFGEVLEAGFGETLKALSLSEERGA
jgi:hypothetical protein